MRTLLKNAPARIKRSLGYSRDALRSVFIKEESFRLECVGFVLLCIFLFAYPWPLWKKLAMAGSYMLIFFAETVNSAIEDVCNLVTMEHSPIVKDAKDKGALAVLFAIILNAFVLAILFLV